MISDAGRLSDGDEQVVTRLLRNWAGARGAEPASPEQTKTLASEYARTRDARTRDAMVATHQNLVAYLAAKVSVAGADHEALVRAGNVGLVVAINQYDPSSGVPFSTYAMPTIMAQIRAHVRDQESRKRRDFDYYAHSVAPRVDAAVSDVGAYASLKTALDNLSERERRVVMRRYIDEVDTKTIAKELNLSAAAVSRILHRAVRHLREDLSHMEAIAASHHGLTSPPPPTLPAGLSRNSRLIALLDSFEAGDPETQRQDLAALQASLNEDRPGQRNLFGEGGAR